MAKKIIIALVSMIIVLAGIGFYFTPYLTYRNIREAAENNDAKALSEYIDFPAIKKSLKENFKAKIEITEKKDGDKFAGMGAAIASAFINPLVDAFVTPETISMMMQGNLPSLMKKERRSKEQQEEKKSEPAGDKKKKSRSDGPDILTYYDSLNKFIVEIRKKGSRDEPIALIFKRNRLIYWKLSAVMLP
jgi:hypothetical protein